MSDVANHTLATLLSHPEQDELKMHPKELTLIVAATSKNMGIGKNGRLPWTGLKKEMAYFARVTKRADEQVDSLCFPRLLGTNCLLEYWRKCCDYGSQDLGEHTS